MAVSFNPLTGRFTSRDWLLWILLVLATTHCVEAIFLVNVSLFDLQAYGNGHVKMPFQGRVALMPLIRWAGSSHLMQKAAYFIQVKTLHGLNKPREIYTPEKVVCMVLGLVATLCAVTVGAFIGWRKIPRVWWLPSALFIYMLYITYAARCDAQFWYPYDLSHFALFGTAALCILYGRWPAAFLLFLLDTPVRETSIYLVPLMLAMGYARRQWKAALPWATAMLIIGIAVRVAIARHFAGNPSDARIHWEYVIFTFKDPYEWAQIASAFGFLVVPFCFGFKYLTREERIFVYGALPGILFTGVFGIWYETRIWDEWLLPAALLFSFQIVRYLAHTAPFVDTSHTTGRSHAWIETQAAD